MANRLAGESSPYLRQHAANPVEWYPWGDEAFAVARREDRPIFLSVGYATCHWCHVMERESFEDPALAEVLNAHFVAVKVDREERPDIDRVYMHFVQATTGAGGWPMSVWLTPDLQPFYGGTYFPPSSRWGRPGFREVLVEIARMWREERPRVTESAAAITSQLREMPLAAERSGPGDGAVPDAAWLEAGSAAFAHAFDPRHGGFGRAPKFPRPTELLFLLREWKRTGDARLRDMVRETMQAMTLGGMRDQVGGGFHRYSVDAAWRVPHFEKMLYDQAQLTLTATELAQATGETFWLWLVDDTLAYVERDLTHHAGGFFSAEDADSVPAESAATPGAHRTEGAFYLWTADEVDALFGGDAEVVRRRFGIEPGGNAPDDPHGEFTGRNIPHVAAALEALVTGERDGGDAHRLIERARSRMFEARLTRPRPELDDKVLTGWNGLMIAAAARAARVFDMQGFDADGAARHRAVRLASRAATFVVGELWDQQAGRLRRRWREGQAGIEAYCEDYACMIWGLLELLQATGDPNWLEWAIRLQDVQDRLFWDDHDAGWFSTTGEDPTVLVRLKEDYDGAEPSATSVGVHNLITLSHLVDRPEWRDRVQRVLARLDGPPEHVARTLPLRAAALSTALAGPGQVLIVGAPGDPRTRALDRVVVDAYQPFTTVVPVVPGAWQTRLAALLPVAGSLRHVDGQPTAYVCRNFTCSAPVTSPEALVAILK